MERPSPDDKQGTGFSARGQSLAPSLRSLFAAVPVPEDLAAALGAEHAIDRAVETGTWRGDGARTLARHFDRVETIELSRRLALRAKLRFALNPRITVRHGDSGRLLAPANEATLYWLDGHWSGRGTAGAAAECPLLEELRATSPGHPSDCYLIDDARFFLKPPPPPHDAGQWPTFDEIREVVRDLRPNHAVNVIGDVIVVAPREAHEHP